MGGPYSDDLRRGAVTAVVTGGASCRSVAGLLGIGVSSVIRWVARFRATGSYSRRAMACTFEVFIDGGRYRNAAPAALAALDLVDRLEDQLSIFRPDSEISRLNRDAAFDPVEVEPRLYALLAEAVELYRETGGAFDITAGQLSRVWGFTRREGRVPTGDELEAARERIGGQHLELDRAAGTVRFLRPGLEINLGSIGKGYALDRLAEQLAAEGIEDCLLHGGASGGERVGGVALL